LEVSGWEDGAALKDINESEVVRLAADPASVISVYSCSTKS
jgi:hypothetical protein